MRKERKDWGQMSQWEKLQNLVWNMRLALSLGAIVTLNVVLRNLLS